ncbi:hypothetical protein GCM10017710_17510 [Arthrobacter ramosus]
MRRFKLDFMVQSVPVAPNVPIEEYQGDSELSFASLIRHTPEEQLNTGKTHIGTPFQAFNYALLWAASRAPTHEARGISVRPGPEQQCHCGMQDKGW